MFIVNAAADVRAPAAPISAGNTPTIMVVTPNLAQTLVYSGNDLPSSDNQFSIISNATETLANHLILPGITESFVVSPDSSTAYVALPTPAVKGVQSLGVVEAIALSNGSVAGVVNVPSARYVAIDNGGDRVLAFSDNSDSVAVITPSQINIGNAVSYIGGPGIFDRPVAAFFSSDDTTAYVISCGAECGGTEAGLQQYNLVTNTLVASVAACAPGTTQCAATAALLNGSTLYLAGTPYAAGGGPSLLCPAGTTQATYCGLLSIIDLNTMAVTNTSPIIITDGYHNKIAMGANGQLFIGAHTCTEISPAMPGTPGEVRGCLSIYNTLPSTTVGTNSPGGVLVPPHNGDVTGLQPITNRAASMPQEVVYVIQGQGVPQGGTLYIYDVTIDDLEYNRNDPNNPGQINGMVGNFYDVKTVDY